MLEHGKIPPQSLDLEEAVLGAILLENVILDVIDILSPESFYLKAHQKIYSAILQLNAENQPIDLLTITNKLKENGHIDDIIDETLEIL